MAEPPAANAPKPCCVCDAPGGKHCTKCKSRQYCSKACQLVDWNEGGHKTQCKQLAAEFQDRLLDELMPAKLKIKEAPAIVEGVAPADGAKAAPRAPAVRPADGAKAAPRAPAVRTADGAKAAPRAPAVRPADGAKAAPRAPAVRTATAVVKASAVNDSTPDWRGTCAICLDPLPFENDRQTFYSCCCKNICFDCYLKCRQHDERCPLCRVPAPKSDAEWLRRMQKHVDKGNAEAQVILGGLYRDGVILGGLYRDGSVRLQQNFKRALLLFELAAAQGYAPAMSKLGCFYGNGKGVELDYKTAALWYRRAAGQGFPPAQFKLGQLFYYGMGVAQSYDEAVRWFRLAAAQGFLDALYNLGVCYGKGSGVAPDLDEALRLVKRAAAKGHAAAALAVPTFEAQIAKNIAAGWHPS